MKTCETCRHMRTYRGSDAAYCKASERHEGPFVIQRDCKSERRLALFSNRCGRSARNWKPKPCGGPVQFAWETPEDYVDACGHNGVHHTPPPDES